MLITGTSDKIQFKLGSTATTELPFTVDYNIYTTTGVTPSSNNGTSNDTTEVDLVPSPTSGTQNELRYCSIYNAESASETVIVQVSNGVNTRVVFQSVLFSGDTLQYQLEKGWEVINYLGNKKNSSLNVLESSLKVGGRKFRPLSVAGSAQLTSNTPVFIHLGRAEKSYSAINFVYNLVGAGSSITWAEISVYSGLYNATEVALSHGKRVGFTNVASVWSGSTGLKYTQVSVSGINPGDILRVWFGCVATVTMPSFRSLGWNVDLSDHSFGSFTGQLNSARLSLVPFMYTGAVGSPSIWVAWQGI